MNLTTKQIALLAGGLLAVAVVVIVASGLFNPTRPPAKGGTPVETVEDSLGQARKALANANDLGTCRSALKLMDDHLGRHPLTGPASLTDETRRLLEDRQHFGLSADELAEVEGRRFTLLDGHHLEAAFLFADAARALDLGRAGEAWVVALFGLGAFEWASMGQLWAGAVVALGYEEQKAQAATAFAWVDRQVQLQQGREDLLPPPFVLRRGWGTALDRSLVFLALLEQLGIPGCLVGDPREGEFYLWACGALIGNHLYLFEPRLGVPFPGPGGKGIATLAAVRQQPELLRPFSLEEKGPYDVTAKQVQQARLYLVCPLSALAPRMRYLEEQLAVSGPGVALAVAPADRLRRFQEAAGHQAGTSKPEVQLLADATGMLRRFLPTEEGGTDNGKRQGLFSLGFVPWEVLPAEIQNLPGKPKQILAVHFIKPFVDLYLEPRLARDHVLRGRFQEAHTELGRRQEQAMNDRRRIKDFNERAQAEGKPTLAEEVGRWSIRVIDVENTLINAEQSKNPADAEAARAARDEVWKEGQRPLSLLIQGASAQPMSLEATYLLALCLHERAERLQAQAARGPAEANAEAVREAWRDAVGWWETYLQEFRATRRAVTACRLQARAHEHLGDRAQAVRLLTTLVDELRPQQPNDRTDTVRWLIAGTRYRIEQMKQAP